MHALELLLNFHHIGVIGIHGATAAAHLIISLVLHSFAEDHSLLNFLPHVAFFEFLVSYVFVLGGGAAIDGVHLEEAGGLSFGRLRVLPFPITLKSLFAHIRHRFSCQCLMSIGSLDHNAGAFMLSICA